MRTADIQKYYGNKFHYLGPREEIVAMNALIATAATEAIV